MGSQESDSVTTRSSFLRQLVSALAAGVGLAAVAASRAKAEVLNCCPDATCGLPANCSFPKIWYRCQCPGIGNYCVCAFNDGYCYNGPC